MQVYSYAPNKLVVKDSNSSTSWLILASDGSSYTTLALLKAAGKVPFPALDPGAFLQTLTLRTEGAAGADGSAFWFALNTAVAPVTATNGELVSGSGQTITGAGAIHVLWYAKSVASDQIVAIGAY